MKIHYMAIVLAGLLLGGCATTNSTTIFNIDNKSIEKIKGGFGGTYSDYDHDITYNPNDHLYYYTIYTGAFASCDNGALEYAKPKLNRFLTQNNFKSYKVLRGNVSMLPMSKCILVIEYKK